MARIVIQRCKGIPSAVYLRGVSSSGWVTWRRLFRIPGAYRLALWLHGR